MHTTPCKVQHHACIQHHARPPPAGKPNTGNLLIKSNPRTRKLSEEWIKVAYTDKGELRHDIHDQEGLWKLQGGDKFYQACKTSQECLELKMKGLAAM
jgi:hypothetical protein